MGPLKKIQYNCKKATFLIEKKLIGHITLREHIELRIHLFGCSVCRVYQKQTGKINEMVRQLFRGSMNADTRLDDSFKKNLQERIENELNKK
jgi:predicted anti-sigma-YlaC factor YlaD